MISKINETKVYIKDATNGEGNRTKYNHLTEPTGPATIRIGSSLGQWTEKGGLGRVREG